MNKYRRLAGEMTSINKEEVAQGILDAISKRTNQKVDLIGNNT